MQQKRNTIEARRQLDYERFKAFERERRRVDEITDASERLALPMRNTFEYELDEMGELSFQGQRLRDIFDNSVKVAEELVTWQPQFMTELIRRRIERQEYDEQRTLALLSGDEPDVLAVISPIPDAVLAGADLGAYDSARKKTLVRIYKRTDAGISATSLSLDLSDRAGLQAIATRFGQTIPDDASSEDILAMRFWARKDELSEDPVTAVRKSYDDTLSRLYGGRWYAGRQDSEVLDAMSFIEAQSDLISEHLAEMDWIECHLVGQERRGALCDARYNFAAALTRRLRGDGDASTLGEAGDMARQNGEEYKNDCPTGGVTVEQSLDELGFGNRKINCKVCPICGARNVIATIDGETISGSCGCEKDICTGAVRRAYAKQAPLLPARHQGRPMANVDPIRSRFGAHALLRTELTIGGVNKVIYDRRTGETIARL